jgi:hypothetical protein
MIEPVEAGLGRSAHFLRVIKAMSETAMVREIEKAAIQKSPQFQQNSCGAHRCLNDQFLQRSRPMNEARLLWEIGHDGAEVRELRSRLGIDSGQRGNRTLQTFRLCRS